MAGTPAGALLAPTDLGVNLYWPMILVKQARGGGPGRQRHY